MRTIITLSIFFSSISFGAIHGNSDDRYEAETYGDLDIQYLARSVAFITKKNLKGQNPFTIETTPLKDFKGMCASQKFSNSPSIHGCSGVLIDTNKVLTAGHCVVSQNDCEDLMISFNYRDHSLKGLFTDKNAYTCKKLLAREKNYLTNLDYAIIQLDRDVDDREPVQINSRDRILKNDPIFMIGHPVGIPTVITTDSKVISNNGEKLLFSTDLDAMVGNSGSPVFNEKTYELEGILVRGGADFDTDFDSDDLCRTWYRANDYPDQKEETEDVLKIDSFSIKGIIGK